MDPETLSSVAGLEVRARHIVEGYLAGLHRSPFHGRSVEFAEHRPYSQGDELKRIDWKVWARSDRFYVKLYEQETNVRTYFLMDASGSMGYGSEALSKYDYGATLAAALAYLLLVQQDAVGLTVFDTRIRTELPPASSPARLREFCRLLEENAAGEGTNLGSLLHLAAERIGRCGLVVLVSDLIAPLEDILSALSRLRYDGHSVIVAHIVDPAELQFPFDGNVEFEGLEQEGPLRTDARQLRADYLDAFNRFQQGVESACLDNEIDYLRASTGERLDTALARFLTARAGGY
ncbi:MAG: DUF58 domain-containing protein [Planctomycetota bacterium]